MSSKYPGGVISKTAPTPSGPYETGAAPGVWTVEQALQYTKQGIWPTAGNVPNYIEDVFSTYLYTGNGSTQTITNGIDLSTYGGLVWVKSRSDAFASGLNDSARGVSKQLISSQTVAQYNNTISGTTYGISAFNSTGFSLNGDYPYDGSCNNSGSTYASWTFRKQPKFFDVVTYNSGPSGTTGFSHNLGSVPATIFFKKTNSTSDWFVYHRSLGDTKWVKLNTTDAETNFGSSWITVTSTTVSTLNLFGANSDIVAYLFAHNAGGFGLTGTDNVISCGSVNYTNVQTDVNLGYEPQWILWRGVSGGNWWLFDTMRGLVVDGGTGTGDKYLYPNSSAAEAGTYGIDPTSTGFQLSAGWGSDTYIYIAIRRGPMKVPTDATKVFIPVAQSTSGSYPRPVVTNFPVDFVIMGDRSNLWGYNWSVQDRLRGNPNVLFTSATSTENTGALSSFAYNTQFGDGWVTGGTNGIYENFQRAPSFFDEVCYTGNGTAGRAITHNLGVTPELIITKERSAGSYWYVYSAATGPTQYLRLEATNAAFAYSGVWNDTAPTSSVFTVGSDGYINASSQTYVAYLFATCAGVSKVGSYTGTGATQTISCGFTGGARFVLIKRTDSTGDWYVWDTARGMVSGTDPSLLLNSTAAEVNANSIYTTTGGFQIVSTAAGINASGGSYLFFAVA